MVESRARAEGWAVGSRRGVRVTRLRRGMERSEHWGVCGGEDGMQKGHLNPRLSVAESRVIINLIYTHTKFNLLACFSCFFNSA